MKTVSFSIMLIFLLGGSVAFSADLKDGFLGIQWGADASGLSNFSKVRENGNVSYYINPGQVYVINNIKVPHVVFGFYEGQFFAVYIKIDNIEVFSEMKGYMENKYGNPSTSIAMKSELKTYKWKYKKTKMKLKYYEKSGYMKLAFYYQPLSRKVNEENQEEFYDKSFRLFPIDKNRKPETLPSIPLLRF